MRTSKTCASRVVRFAQFSSNFGRLHIRMKVILVIASFAVFVSAQRPTYAGSEPIGRPGLASRFKGTEEESTPVPIVNRLGEDGSTEKLPVDARGDGNLVNRLQEWPRENRPFWLLNAEKIEAHRNQPNPQNQIGSRSSANQDSFEADGFDRVDNTQTIRPLPQRSSFLGPIQQ